tara:strand:- start:394 stop:789 length:396 start_codon:yes stop_codon:yes gene_type:complete
MGGSGRREKERIKAGWVPVPVRLGQYMLIEALIIGGFVLSITIQLLVLRSTHALLLQLLETLDQRIAEAIQSVLNDLPLGDLPEPPSPLAQFLLGLLQDSMGSGSQGSPAGLPRDLKGQFQNVVELNTDQS